MRTPFFIALVLALVLCGCATTGGARWFAPATWFSSSEAKSADKAGAKLDEARERAIKAAQATAHETKHALEAAPESRAVEVARESNDQTVTLLDQVAGPITASEADRIRRQVDGLLSDNAALRAEGEKLRAANRAQLVALSGQLEKFATAFAKAQGELRTAFERENALANELRTQRAVAWIAGGIAVLCAAGWIYVKFFLGGMPTAIGLALKKLRAERPELAEQVAPFYAKYLNRHEQAAIARHAE